MSQIPVYADHFLAAGRHAARENGLGVAVSLGLHALALLLVLAGVTQHLSKPQVLPPAMPLVPVDIIRLGDETRSPPAEHRALMPQQKAGKPQEEASPERATVSPTGKKPPPPDALDAKLRDLARLKQPNSPLKLEGQGLSNIDAANGPVGDHATYSIRDYVLAQVLRRWTLNLERAKDRGLIVPIQVTMKRDGTIAEAEIVELARSKTDAVYRDVAIGARNAVLLSSPISLPPGDYPKEMHFTLRMDARAVLR